MVLRLYGENTLSVYKNYSIKTAPATDTRHNMSKEIQVLPKLADLHLSPELAFKNDQLKMLLNAEPHSGWVKKNPFANNASYIPIDKVEFLLDRIFQLWKVEVLSTTKMFSAIQVTIRLHYLNPVTGEWMYHDGVGAKELQTVKDSGPLKLDFSNVQNGAVEKAVPIAKSAAIKDAADHLGKLFGRDLNRKDTVSFSGSYNQEQAPSPLTNNDNFTL